jgi:ABC-type Na+ transport system ATPase subunit NatA
LGDAVGVQRKKRKISETEAAQGLESDFQTVDSLLKNLRREYDISSTEKERILDDLKKKLETSKKETKEAEKISTGCSC